MTRHRHNIQQLLREIREMQDEELQSDLVHGWWIVPAITLGGFCWVLFFHAVFGG